MFVDAHSGAPALHADYHTAHATAARRNLVEGSTPTTLGMHVRHQPAPHSAPYSAPMQPNLMGGAPYAENAHYQTYGTARQQTQSAYDYAQARVDQQVADRYDNDIVLLPYSLPYSLLPVLPPSIPYSRTPT